MFGKLKEDYSKTIIVNAGHWDDPKTPQIDGPGAVYNHVYEQVEVAKIRDELVPLLENRGYVVKAVPDNLNLRKSIDWANQQVSSKTGGLAIAIHLNYLSDHSARGTEAFFIDEDSKDVATALAQYMSKEMGIPNRGAKPDSETAVGSLGWLRQNNALASLIEVCFLTNAEDMAVLEGTGGYLRAATAIADAIDYLYGVEASPAPNPLETYTTMQLINELKRRIATGTL